MRDLTQITNEKGRGKTEKSRVKKKMGEEKKTASDGKQSISEKELSYLRKRAESSAIGVFANRKPLRQ